MRLKKLAAAVAGASLLVSPTLATAQSQAAPAPQAEVVNGGSGLVERRPAAFPWLPVAGFILAAFALYLLLDDGGDEVDQPVSP